MPIFNFSKAFDRPAYTLNDENIIHFMTGKDDDDYVSANTALKNSDIYSLIAQLSGDLALANYNADSDRTQSLLNHPDSTTNGFAYWQAMFAQLLLDGNCYSFRWRNKNGVDLRWEYLRPSQVQPMLEEDGTGLIYNVDFDEPEIGHVENIPQSDMIHIRLVSKNGGKTGISPLLALANELEIKKDSNDLTKHALKQSVLAPGILSIQGGGLLDTKKKIKHSHAFMQQVNDPENGPVVLDDLETYQPLEVKSDVANLLSQADWTGKQIAKVYGVPDSYLNGQGDQQSNITQIGGQYAKALNRYVQPIISELNLKLNATITCDIRPATDALGDTYASTISGLAKDGTITGNQARFILQKNGYLPDDMPAPEKQPAPVVIQTTQQTEPDEGGDDDDNED